MHPVNNQDRTWASPAAAGPVSARVRLPASKSITNRALVLVVNHVHAVEPTVLARGDGSRWFGPPGFWL